MDTMKNTKEIRFKNPDIPPVPVGTICTVSFSDEKHTLCKLNISLPDGTQKQINFAILGLAKYFADDFTEPTLEQLGEWVNDGIAETVLGNRTEPDGFDEYGAPSWLLVLGMI